MYYLNGRNVCVCEKNEVKKFFPNFFGFSFPSTFSIYFEWDFGGQHANGRQTANKSAWYIGYMWALLSAIMVFLILVILFSFFQWNENTYIHNTSSLHPYADFKDDDCTVKLTINSFKHSNINVDFYFTILSSIPLSFTSVETTITTTEEKVVDE